MARITVLAVSAGIAALMLFPQVGSAQVASDPTLGVQAIQNHDWANAEKQLMAGLQDHPGDLSRQLNLAWVYAQTGRKAEAANLYREIMKRDQDRVASLSSRDGASMTVLAERGLSMLNQ